MPYPTIEAFGQLLYSLIQYDRATAHHTVAPIMTRLKPNHFTAILLASAVPLLALSSISARSAGFVWLLISLAGIVAWISDKARPSTQTQSHLHPALPAAQWWLLACCAAFLLMAIPTAYWGGPWSERHPQWRLMIGASGLWLLLRHSAPSVRMVQAMATAVAVSCLLAYGLVMTSGSSAAPTNRIPWMAGLALLSCTLLILCYSMQNASIRLRQFWLAASAVMLVTALISGVRGSWPLLLIWPLMLWRLHGSAPQLWARCWKWILPLLAVLLAVGLHVIPEADNPTARITAVLQETGATLTGTAMSQDTSSGVRLALYELGISNVLNHPLLGLGPIRTKQLIKGELASIGAYSQLAAIGHMHNDLLHPWMEFGLFGLAGYLAYAAGMVVAAWHLCRTAAHHGFNIGLIALLVMHLSTGMSNMNFAHNYYPLMLALSTALVILGCQGQATETPSSSSENSSC